jgi:hypothetical protein
LQSCKAFALTPGLPSSWPATLQPLCLGRKPKARVATEEVVVVVVEIERVLGKLGETPYELMKEEQDETMFGESTTNRQLHVLNETFVNFFGKRIDGKAGLNTTFSTNTNNHYQLSRSKEHKASTRPKFVDTRLKCAKCRGGQD